MSLKISDMAFLYTLKPLLFLARILRTCNKSSNFAPQNEINRIV